MASRSVRSHQRSRCTVAPLTPIHSICVPAGAYTDTGATNCCRDPITGKAEPGSYGNEQLDVQTFADYGVDQVNGVVHLYFSPSAGC